MFACNPYCEKELLSTTQLSFGE